MTNSIQTKNLDLKLECDNKGYTIVTHRYTAYPLGISRTFRPDTAHPHRIHLYITSTSPGLLADDQLNISLQLAPHTYLYLTDQSATKVHSMPMTGSKASTDYDIEIGEGATLEFVPNPIILFKDAILEQKTRIKCYPTAQLFWSEILVPGRLAMGEFYQFHHYFNRLQVTSSDGELWCTDTMYLQGKLNPFKDSPLFSPLPILGSIMIISRQTDLKLLSKNLEAANCSNLMLSSSILPQDKGLLVRAIASSTYELKNYLQYALNQVKNL